MIKEEWLDIVGYEGRYQVSNLGNVKSLRRYRAGKRGAPTIIQERILKCSHGKNGYLVVSLRDGKSCKQFPVHRLVAIAFIPKPVECDQINHIDEDKENNCVSNLEWCTQEYNNSYGTRLERCSKSIGKPIVGTNGETVLHFDSARHAARELGLDASSITAACKGRLKTSGGYSWSYERRDA